MKVSNHQLRKIIREEFSRPVRVYTDDELMNEGLLDFIGGLFGKMTGFFKDLSGGTQDAASKTSSDAESSGNSAIAKAAKTAGREDVGGVEDLDLDDKTIPIICYCYSGFSSKTACRNLEQTGYENVYNLRRGFPAWKRAGGKIEN